MLYDILFIDDDFEDKTDSNASRIIDDANKLFLALLRENLRVIYTTGEIDDIKKLESKDLSCIQYIFCDLHLLGIKEGDGYKIINSKLNGIFQNLYKKIKSDKVTIFINSKYYEDQTYNQDGQNDLQEKLEEIEPGKFLLEVMDKKNTLNKGKKDLLLKNQLDIYIKSFIISKALEIENMFDKKLNIDEEFVDVIIFGNKYKVFKNKYDVSSLIKTRIQLLQQMRNKVAHSKNKLCLIKDNKMKQTFWKIIKGKNTTSTDNIKFESLKELVKYIDSIDLIIEEIMKQRSKDE